MFIDGLHMWVRWQKDLGIFRVACNLSVAGIKGLQVGLTFGCSSSEYLGPLPALLHSLSYYISLQTQASTPAAGTSRVYACSLPFLEIEIGMVVSLVRTMHLTLTAPS